MNTLFFRQYMFYGLLAGLLVSVFAWLKSEFYFTGIAPDLFLTLVALFFAGGGWFLHAYFRRQSVNKTNDSSKLEIASLLSKREMEVLHYLLGNDANKQIADKLSVEMSTLKTHINTIYKKTGVQSRKELRLKFAPPDSI